jgi:hypothetical protein
MDRLEGADAMSWFSQIWAFVAGVIVGGMGMFVLLFVWAWAPRENQWLDDDEDVRDTIETWRRPPEADQDDIVRL